MDVYSDSFAFVQFHHGDEDALPWGEDRWAFYGAEFTPLAVFDGADLVVGAVHDVDQQYSIYRANHFLPERAVPTDVTIELSATDLGGQVRSRGGGFHLIDPSHALAGNTATA